MLCSPRRPEYPLDITATTVEGFCGSTRMAPIDVCKNVEAPTSDQVVPPSMDFKIPCPGCAAKDHPASPVPA